MYIQLTDICYLCRRVLEMLACGLGDEGAKALAKNLPSCFLQGEVDPAERREALLDLRVNAFTNAGVSREEEESSFSVEESSFFVEESFILCCKNYTYCKRRCGEAASCVASERLGQFSYRNEAILCRSGRLFD